MKLRIPILIGFLAMLAVGGGHLGSSQSNLVLALHNPGGVRASVGLGIDDQLGMFTIQQTETLTTYSDGRYHIEITETPSPRRTLVRVVIQKHSGEAFRLSNFSLTAYVP